MLGDPREYDQLRASVSPGIMRWMKPETPSWLSGGKTIQGMQQEELACLHFAAGAISDDANCRCSGKLTVVYPLKIKTGMLRLRW